MKNLRKICVLLLSIVIMSGLCACELFMPKAETGKKTVTVVFDMTGYEGEIQVSEGISAYEGKKKEFTVETEATRLEAVLDELAEDKKLTFAGSKSSAGLMLTDLDNISPKDRQFIAIYTDDEENSDTTWGTYVYNEKTLGSAKVGVTALPVKDGKVYVFAISAW